MRARRSKSPANKLIRKKRKNNRVLRWTGEQVLESIDPRTPTWTTAKQELHELTRRLLPFSFHLPPPARRCYLARRKVTSLVGITAHQCAVTITLDDAAARRGVSYHAVGVTGTLQICIGDLVAYYRRLRTRYSEESYSGTRIAELAERRNQIDR